MLIDPLRFALSILKIRKLGLKEVERCWLKFSGYFEAKIRYQVSA